MNFGRASLLTVLFSCAIFIATANNHSVVKYKHHDPPGSCYNSPAICSDSCSYGCKLGHDAPANCPWSCFKPESCPLVSTGVAIIITIMVSLVVALALVMFFCCKYGCSCCSACAGCSDCCQPVPNNREQSQPVLPNSAISPMTHQATMNTLPPQPTSPNGPNVNPSYDINYKAMVRQRPMAEVDQNLPSYNAINNQIDPPPQYPRY